MTYYETEFVRDIARILLKRPKYDLYETILIVINGANIWVRKAKVSYHNSQCKTFYYQSYDQALIRLHGLLFDKH